MRRSKALLALGAALSVGSLVTAAAVVAAAPKPRTGVAEQGLDKQTVLWRTGKNQRAFTTSKAWEELQMPRGGCTVGSTTCSGVAPTEFMLPAKGEISLTFSGNFSRAPVEIRFRDGAKVMRPGAAQFNPSRNAHSLSFTFVSPRKGERLCEGPSLEWRSPTGAEVRLNKATIVVHYKKFTPDKPVGCL